MDLQYFKDFLVLSEKKNYLEAAEVLYISQSVLSKHIQKMEAELGISLFIRNTRSVELSDYGKLFLPYAATILEAQKGYQEAITNQMASKENTLEIGSISALAQYNITDIIAGFKKAYKNITINITLGRSSELFEKVKTGKCNFAFIREAEKKEWTDDDPLVRIPYAQDELAVVLPIDHPYARQKSISLSLLANENFMFLGTDNMPFHLCRNACLQCGFEPKISFTNRQPETLIELVGSGMGIAMLMKPLAQYFATSQVAVVPITPTFHSYLGLFYLRKKHLTYAEKVFLNYIKANIPLH